MSSEAKEKYITAFEEICTENVDDVLTICLSATDQLLDKFKINLADDKGTADPRLAAVIFSKTFDCILDELKNQQKGKSECNINICKRFNIGYTTNENSDDEKVGNFCIYLNHLNISAKQSIIDTTEEKSIVRCTQWNTVNVEDQPEIIKNIAANAVSELKKIDVVINSSETIMPIFITVYENIINYIIIKRAESNAYEFTINFASCFDITARESEDGTDIVITPSINSKLYLKDDSSASGKYE